MQSLKPPFVFVFGGSNPPSLFWLLRTVMMHNILVQAFSNTIPLKAKGGISSKRTVSPQSLPPPHKNSAF